MQNSTKKLDIISRRCDLTSMFGFCMLMYFLPISSALLEWSFAFIFVPYLIKRGFIFFYKLKVQFSEQNQQNILKLFLKSFKPVSNPLNKPVIVFLFALCISTIFSLDVVYSLKGLVFDLLQGIFIYFIMIEVLVTQKRLRVLFIVFMLITFIISLNGFFQIVGGEGFIHHNSLVDGRVTSTFEHPNDFSGYLIWFIPIVLGLSYFFRKNEDLDIQNSDCFIRFMNNRISRIIFTLTVVIALTCLGWTFSRGAWLTLISMLIFYSIINKRNMVVFAAIGILFISAFYPQMKNVRNVSLISDNVQYDMVNEKTMVEKVIQFRGMGRGTFWNEAANVIKHHPIVGAGLKNYRNAGALYNSKWTGYHAHNCYLQLLAETGIIGLISFLWVIVVLFKETFSNLRSYKNSFYSVLTCGLFVGVFGYLFQSTFDTNFYSTELSTLFWFAIGLLVAVQQNFLIKKN